MSSLSLSRHAAIRARQRGVSGDLLDAFFSLADAEAPVGGGCVALSVSRTLRRDRTIRAAFGPMLDRIADLALIVADDGHIVTVMHDRGGRAARRYRRTH